MDWKSLLRGNLNRMADSQHREKKEVNSTIELVIRSEVTCVTVEAELNGIVHCGPVHYREKLGNLCEQGKISRQSGEIQSIFTGRTDCH